MKADDILGIPNRTENWRTAKAFAPVITHNRQNELATWVIGNAKGARVRLGRDQVRLEIWPKSGIV